MLAAKGTQIDVTALNFHKVERYTFYGDFYHCGIAANNAIAHAAKYILYTILLMINCY